MLSQSLYGCEHSNYDTNANHLYAITSYECTTTTNANIAILYGIATHECKLQLHVTGNMNATDSMMQLALMNYATMKLNKQHKQTTSYGNKTTSIRQMANSGPNSDRLHNDNKSDSICAP